LPSSRFALSERLENLRLQHEQGVLASIDFLKGLLVLAKDVVEAEREVPEADQEDRGKAALTELFETVKNTETPVIVERALPTLMTSFVKCASPAGSRRRPASARCRGHSEKVS
jgi:microcystin degradation protein MlrC